MSLLTLIQMRLNMKVKLELIKKEHSLSIYSDKLGWIAYIKKREEVFWIHWVRYPPDSYNTSTDCISGDFPSEKKAIEFIKKRIVGLSMPDYKKEA